MEILAKNEEYNVWLGVDFDDVFYISTESERGIWKPIGMDEEKAKKFFNEVLNFIKALPEPF